MRSRFFTHLLLFALLIPFIPFAAVVPLAAQKQPSNPQQTTPPTPSPAGSTTPAPASEKIIVPTGTRLPLLLRNGINTRTSKPGDSVYFETLYPIAVNNRIAIPMGSFVRGEILESKRPGRIKGRGEFRIAIEQMTFPNGYTIELIASPNSVDRDGREGVDSEGKIKGPSSAGRDTAMVLLATGGGAYIGTLVGAITNGAPGRGALIGGGAAGLGTLIAVLATRGPEAELPRGTTLDIVFDRPLILDSAYLPTGAGAGVDPQLRNAPPPTDARKELREQQKKRLTQSVLRSILLHPF